MTKEQLDELKEMLINGDHPTKRHRADLIALIVSARQTNGLSEQIESPTPPTDEAVQQAIGHLLSMKGSIIREGYKDCSSITLAIRALQQYKPVEPCEWCENAYIIDCTVFYRGADETLRYKKFNDSKICPSCGRRLRGDQP